jgi:hypothetical protein
MFKLFLFDVLKYVKNSRRFFLLSSLLGEKEFFQKMFAMCEE